MGNRLTIREFAGLLAESTGKDSDSIEQFLNEFVSVVREHIFSDRLVQIKNIGNFKIIQVEKRESIDVNTKERIVIPEHYKLSFVPDKDMREIVNKPFAFFESIEISGDTDFDSIGMGDLPEEKEEDAEEETEIETIEKYIKEIQSKPPPPPKEEPPLAADENTEKEAQPADLYPEEEKIEDETDTAKIIQDTTQTIEDETETIEDETGTIEDETGTKDMEEVHAENKTEQQFNKDTTMVDDGKNRMGPYEPRSNNNTLVVLLLVLVVILVISLVSVLVFNKDALFGGNNNTLATTTLPVDTSTDFALPPDDDTSLDDEWGNEEDESFDDIEAPLPDPVAPPVATAPVQNRSTGLSQRRTVVVERGDRLNLFALKYYGNKVFWVYIYQYNQSKLGNPDNIPVGVELIIPAANEYQIDANNPASVRKASVLQGQILAQYASSHTSPSWNGGRSPYPDNYSSGNQQPYQYPSYSQDNYNSGSSYGNSGSSYGGTYGTEQYGGSYPYGNTQNANSDPYNPSGNNSGYEYGGGLYDNSLNVTPYNNNDNTQYNNTQNNNPPYNTNPYR
jgi:nucleoid DNA-binding protein/nucleoid-associated protein YgaU